MAGGLVSAIIKGSSNAGENNRVYSGFGDPNSRDSQAYDPNAKFYNGSPTGRQDYNDDLRNRQARVDGRAAPLADYGEANEWSKQSALARGGQQRAVDLIWNRA